MSNFLAVATVTAALSELVGNAINRDVPGHVPGALVTHLPPQGKEIDVKSPAVNIYMYGASRNIVFENMDLPTRRAGGGLLQRPQTALTLNYLLSFYGDDHKLEPQRLMGTVLSALRAQPILSRKLIQATSRHYDYLLTSDLDTQVELVKLSFVPMSLEELSKLWSILMHTEYGLSCVYDASVILIDEPLTTEQVLPVRRQQVFVGGFREPVISSVHSDSPEKPIFPDSTIVLRGRNLKGEATLLQIGSRRIAPLSVTDSEVRGVLSVEKIPELRAGVQSVQVVHLRPTGKPPQLQLAAISDARSFMLHPVIQSFAMTPVPKGVRIEIHLSPVVQHTQVVALTLNAWLSPEPGHSFLAERREQDSDVVFFVVTNLASGRYLIRVQVGGAQSTLAVDEDPQSPTYQEYIAPLVTLP